MEKRARFKRVAGSRVRRLLYGLKLLGNCANKYYYEYTEEEVKQIFEALEKELKRVNALFQQTPEFRI